MYQLGFVTLSVALVIGWAATLAGFLAPWWPAVDILNHFRPFAVAGSGLLLVLSLASGSRRLSTGAANLFMITFALLLAALLLQAPRVMPHRSFLRVATLNTWIEKGQGNRIVHFVEQTQADIILLQEIGTADQAEVLPQLRSIYPFIFFDESKRRSPAILSKRSWLAAGIIPGATDHPVAVWARFEQDGRLFEIMSVHAANPLLPEEQADDIGRLIAAIRSRAEPMIVGGDFNLTPFSWGLTKLAQRTGLRWAQTFSASWPADRLFPFVLIDHVLVQGPLGVVKIDTAESVGSDHLPVVAELAFRE